VNSEAKNMKAIAEAKAKHNRGCPFPPHTIRMNPADIERMGWEEGETIAGLRLEADPDEQTDRFSLVCDGSDLPELDETVDAIASEHDRLVRT
jgi:hypothetical protein